MTVTIDFNDPAVREELGEILQETLDGIDESTILGAPLPEVAGHDGTVVESHLVISGGGKEAALILRVPLATAVALTAAMIEESPDDISAEEACGSIGELSNVVAGSAKTLIDDETELRVPKPELMSIDSLTERNMVQVHHRLGRFEAVLDAAS
ncbi:MAG: chemotaxis protein CheX [Ilumatobacter sp.]